MAQAELISEDESATAADVLSRPPAPRAPQDAVGLRIGRFAILQVVGTGGMGTVYAAYDPQLDRKVAVKLVHRRAGGSEGRSQLLREAQALAKVSHPHVVAIHDVGTHEGEVFLAMEFVTGVDLRRWLRERSRPWQEALEKFIQVGEGLQAVHAAGLVHRDVKPGNVLVGVDGRVRLADFGLVGATGELASGSETSSEDEEGAAPSGILMGTPGYMSPEQHRRQALTPASDQFSFCVALWEALHGQRPFRGPGIEGLAAAKLAGEVAAPPPESPVPAWLRAVVRRGLAAAPGERWPSMAALLAALRDDPAARRRRRLQFAGWLGLAAALGLAAVLAALAGLAAWRRAEAEALAERHLAATTQRIEGLEAAGDHAGAAAALEAFVAAEEHRGTRALARAWLGAAERARQRGDLPAARAAFGSAYSAATEPEGALDALRGLAGMLHETWSIDHLEVVLATLARVADGSAEGPELRAWRVEVAAAQRDLTAAAALAEGAWAPEIEAVAPVLRGLAGATATAHAGARVEAIGADQIALARETEVTLVGATAALPTQATIPLPERLSQPPWVLTSRTGETWLLGRREIGGERAELIFYELRGGALRELLRWEDALPHDATLLGGEEEPAIYVGIGPFARRLVELRRARGKWSRGSPQPRIDAASSDVSAVAALDLDGDGREELAVAVGAWRAYDLRVLRRREAGAPLELAAREKLGTIAALTGLRGADGRLLLAAAKVDEFPNPTLFPEGDHFGAPAGISLWRFDGAALQAAGTLPLRDAAGGPAWSVRWMRAGDVDGDGREDLVSQIRDADDPQPSVVIDRQLEAGGFARTRVRGAVARGLVEVDGDPQRELVVEVEGRLWVLGAGSEAPPRLAPARPAAREVEAGADPTLAETQRRAEELVGMGLGAEAAGLLVRSAGLALEAPQRAPLLQRAAELYAAAGAIDEALRAYEQLARVDAAAGLQGAARLYQEGGRSAEALARAEELLALGEVPAAIRAEAAAQRDALAPLARPGSVVTWRFDQALDERWRIADPIGVRRDALRGALQVDAFADTGVMAGFPVEWEGGALTIEVALSSARLEWNSGVTIALRPAERPKGAPIVGVGVASVGSRSDLIHRLQCVHPEHARPLTITEVAAPGAEAPLRGTLRLELQAGRVVCAWTPEGGPTRRVVHPLRAAPGAGRHELVIAPVVHGDGPDRPWARVRVERITIGNARAGEVRGARSARANRLHAEGELAAALAAYPEGARAASRIHLWRSAALFELGDPRGAEAALELALQRVDAEAKETLGHLLRLQPERYGPPLRARDPERYYFTALAMWLLPLMMNPDETALRPLAGLLPAADADDPRAAQARMWLLAHRGRAWLRRGEQGRARRDLEAALAAAAQYEAKTTDATEIARATTGALLDLTVLAAQEGRVDAALEHAGAALARTRAPEVLGDELWVRKELAPLRDDPRWRALLGR